MGRDTLLRLVKALPEPPVEPVIGAAIARPDRVTVTALGDGGAMMSIADLETAIRLGLSMLIVVYNDSAYGAEVHHFAFGRSPRRTRAGGG